MKGNRAVDLSLVLLLTGLITAAAAFHSYHDRSVSADAGRQLTTLLMLRESVLRSHLDSLRSEVTLWSGQDIVRDILKRLNRANHADDADTIASFGAISTDDLDSAAQGHGVETLQERLQRFAEHHGYYDVFLVGPEGDVLFTVAGEEDAGTNLIDGPFADTGLGRLYAELMTADSDVIAMQDFSRYPPSDNEPAAFIGAKVMENGAPIGVYAIQIPERPINQIMQFSAGMGETGETYLVGADHLMRSTSRFFDESTVLSTPITGETVDAALQNGTGVAIVDDYRGVSVFSAYRPFEFEGIRWAMLAEKDVAEVRAPVIRARWWLLGGLVLALVIILVLRYMLVRVVLPTSIAALLGLGYVAMDHADD